MRLSTPFAVLAVCLTACSSMPSSGLSVKAEAALISDTHSKDEWSLSIGEAEDLVRVLLTADQGDWYGEGSDGEGPGSLTKGWLRFQGSWSGGQLEGPFVGFYRGLLLINGRAKGGVPIDGTLYQHVVYDPIYSSSWTAEQIQFIRGQAGTHSLMAFSGIFEEGEPRKGRFGTVDDDYRVTSYIDGTSDTKRIYQGTYSLFKLGGIDFDNLEPADDEYELVRTGVLVDGLEEGHWAGPDLDAIYEHGKREGFCRRRLTTLAANGDYGYAWLSANYEADKPLGAMRLTFEKLGIEFQEFTPGPNIDSPSATGWMLAQPRVGAPYMTLVDRSGEPLEKTRKELSVGTTLASLQAGRQWLELEGGARWHGGVKDGRPNGFGRRYGRHAFTFFEEGWFEAGEPTGYVVGVSYRDNVGHSPHFFYVWRDGVELSQADDSAIYRVEEKTELDDKMAEIRLEMREWALRNRPAEEQVWYGVASQKQVFDASGHEVPPVMKQAGDVSVGDIVCQEFRSDGSVSHAFLVVERVATDERGYTSIHYIGVRDTSRYSQGTMLTTFRRSDTGPFFENLVSACQVCAGGGIETFIDQSSDAHTQIEIDGGGETWAVTYTTTTYFENTRTCTNCSGLGGFTNWALGN